MEAIKRFYKEASAAEAAKGGWQVLLDDRALRSPARKLMIIPSQAAAEYVANEWRQQGETIDPEGLPAMGVASLALDFIGPEREKMVAEMLSYAETDLVCYRANQPEPLVRRQRAAWNPLLDWLKAKHGVILEVTESIQAIPQSEESLKKLEAYVLSLDDFRLAVLVTLTRLTGSLVVAMALLDKHITPEQAITAARVDEDHQQELWGKDEELERQEQSLRRDVQAVYDFYFLL